MRGLQKAYCPVRGIPARVDSFLRQFLKAERRFCLWIAPRGGFKTSLFKLPLPPPLLGGWWIGGGPRGTEAFLAQDRAAAICTLLTTCCAEAMCRAGLQRRRLFARPGLQRPDLWFQGHRACARAGSLKFPCLHVDRVCAHLYVYRLHPLNPSKREGKKVLEASVCSPHLAVPTGQSGGAGTKEILEGRYSV